MRIKPRYVVLNLILLFLEISLSVDVLLAIAVTLWMNLLLYALDRIYSRSMMFAYLVAFFTFLMGREVVQRFFEYKTENFMPESNRHLYICLIISLTAIMLSYLFYSKNTFKWKSNRSTTNQKHRITYSKDATVMQISKYVFIISWFFAVVSRVIVARFVSANSYTDYYTDYSEYLTGNTLLYLISKIETIMPLAICIYAASLPSLKEFKVPFIMYCIYLGVSLGSGQRSTFMLGILFMVVYFFYRNNMNRSEGWIKKRYLIIGCVLVPVLIVLFTFYSYWRFGSSTGDITFFSGLIDFFYDQGVSGSIIKRGFEYRESLPEQIYTLEFLHSGLLARLLGIPVYHGNTVEHALHGGSLTHAMGYTLMGTQYLAGRGTGSSYIAELYYDFGYIGVIFGNLLYGYIIARINKVDSGNKVFLRAIRFYIITQILWAPRGSFTGFLSNLHAPTTVVVLLFVFGSAQLIKGQKHAVKKG